MRIVFRIVLIACVALGALAPSALAQGSPEPGVTVDPNSPAGKEYSLPVPQARQETQGSKTKKKSDRAAPLFGEGVTSGTTNSAPPATTTNSTPPTTSTPATSSSAGTASSAAKAKARAKAKAKAKAKRAEARRKAQARKRAAEKRKKAAAAAVTTKNSPPPPTPQEVTKIAADSGNPSGGLGSSVLFGLIGLAVLVFGGAAGLLLRRRLQSSP